MQTEYGILDYSESHGEHPIEYVGTKELYDCIFILIKNESKECFFTHIDKEMKKNFFTALNQFKKPTSQLEIILIGGMPPIYSEVDSQNILKNIVKELIVLANRYEITIVGQKLINHNHLQIEKNFIEKGESTGTLVVQNKPQIYQNFCRAVLRLFLLLHDKNFNSAFINTRYPSPDSLNREIMLTAEKRQQMIFFVFALIDVHRQMPIKALKLIEQKCPEIKSTHKGQKKTQGEINFYQQVSNTMSAIGAEALSAATFGKTSSILTDFVIELKTGQVFSIPGYVKTYNEELRIARGYDTSTNKTFLFFSGQHYQPIPALKEPFDMDYSTALLFIKESKNINCDNESLYFPLLELSHFKRRWQNQIPSLRNYHVSILSDSLKAIFGSNRLGLKDTQAQLISEYATEACCEKTL